MPPRDTPGEESDSSDPPPRSRRRHTSNKVSYTSGTGSGIFSNVISFVSREIGEFVVNATGGAEASASQPVAGPSRSRDGERRTEKRHRRQSTPSQPQHDVRASKRVRREEDHRDTKPRRTRAVDQVEHRSPERDTPRAHASLSPHLQRPRSNSVTMPGSLFERSLTPDDPPGPPDPDSDTDSRHVRFASDVVSPVPRPLRRRSHPPPAVSADEEEETQSDEDYDGGTSSDPSSPDRADGIYPALPSTPRPMLFAAAGPSSHRPPSTPFRPPTIRSVKDAIAKLDGDSPPKGARPSTLTWGSKEKGKAREMEPQVLWPTMDRNRAEGSIRPHLDVTSRLPSSVGTVDGARRVDAFLRSGADATEENLIALGRTPSTPEDEADKRRIRELEEKVKSLENELARRPPPHEPPPPPPPPPPPLPISSTSRILLSASPRRGSGVNNVLASVRAGLKHTSNQPETSKVMPKNRLPTVPADKMEAFLSELKTVRLRKVGSGEDLSRNSTANSLSGLSNRSSRDCSRSSSQGSFQDDRSVVGSKRKRVDSGNEIQSTLSVASIKRRFQPVTAAASSSRPFLTPPHLSSLPHSQNVIPKGPLPPEVDGTTPSLCSDNDNEAEDRVPSTPPLGPTPNRPYPSRRESLPDADAGAQQIEVRTPRERRQEADIRKLSDLDVRAKVPLTRPSRSLSPTGQTSASTRATLRQADIRDDPFSRRPPSSPLLPETPRRPRPPARVRSESKAAPRLRSQSHSLSAPGDSDDDPLSMSFSAPDEESTPAPDAVGRRRPAQRRRRLTLEDEIRKVDSSYSEEERAVNDLESGVLMGVGQRSKQMGYLAHGGAGGEPVFMGVGYVEGVEDDNPPRNPDKEARKRKSSSSGRKRKPKR